MNRPGLHREKSLVMPEVSNPFYHRIHLSCFDKIKIGIMSVTVVPLRLFLIAMMLLLVWPIAFLALLGRSEDDLKKPLSGWRKAMSRGPVIFLGRSMFFFCGFHYIKVIGRKASSVEAPLLCLAPHSTFFDIISAFACNLPSGVSRVENAKLPCFGTLTKYTQPVLVSREDPDSRQNTIREITRRAQSNGEWPQIIIFPEGTCTNRTCLISFKQGAFCPGVPVQPVCIRYPNSLDTVTWTWDGPDALTTLWLTLCQFHNSVTVEFLPVYYPNEEEKTDPKLYAHNVRALMARALKVPVTDHTFDDCRLMMYAAKNKLPMSSAIVEFHKLSKKLGITFDKLKDSLDKFIEMSKSHTGEITLDELAEYLGVPVSDSLREMFNVYDRDGSGTIDFREYVIGLSVVSAPANTDDTLQLAFQLFDKDSKGYIVESELSQILNNAFGMSEVDVSRLFEEVDLDSDGNITFDEFKAYAEKRPEYATLFQTYHEMKNKAETDNGRKKED